jgi:hypothetical protein
MIMLSYLDFSASFVVIQATPTLEQREAGRRVGVLNHHPGHITPVELSSIDQDRSSKSHILNNAMGQQR